MTVSNPTRQLRIRADRRTAFTLIELLVVIAIIALLISILLPSLYSARNEAMAGKCMSNVRSIGQSTSMYFDDHGGSTWLPWYRYPAYGARPGQSAAGSYNIRLWTPWVFGGFKAPNPGPADGDPRPVDCEEYPAQARPLNKFVDATAQGDDIIQVYICPSDRTNTTAIIGSAGGLVEDEMRSSWEANGSSYTLNTRWAQGYFLPTGNFPFPSSMDTGEVGIRSSWYGNRISKHMIGGEASELIIWVEQGMYSATYRAGPTTEGIGQGSYPQRSGWHRKFSSYTAGFADGHAKYGFFDTRQIYGLRGTIWQPNFNHGL